MKRPVLISVVAAAVTGLGTAAVFASGFAGTVVAPGPDAITAEPTAGATEVPTPVETPTSPVAPTATPQPTVTPAPTPTATPVGDVAAVQQALTDLGYYVGAIDGRAGPATASAVQAFQKVQGLSADGAIGPNTLAALESPFEPTMRGGPPNRVEVNLDDQVMYVVQGDRLTRILPISSGSGETYATPSGGTARSVTPVGDFSVERHISGERHAPLGTLYDPMYFYGGWAIHGSNSVPAYPASHGCVRVTRADARWLFDRLPIGTTVSVYGNTNAFSPALGESAGTNVPAGDTAETSPEDGIQTEEPQPSEPETTPSQPTTPPAPQPTETTTSPTPQPTTPDATPPSTDPAPPPATRPPGESPAEVAPTGGGGRETQATPEGDR
ncbi:MAG TPA: L,D-transpeptidase family protein [Euzebya sp.]|nr:L,D-transpeptidase family protein [Euzebya sp.]